MPAGPEGHEAILKLDRELRADHRTASVTFRFAKTTLVEYVRDRRVSITTLVGSVGG